MLSLVLGPEVNGPCLILHRSTTITGSPRNHQKMQRKRPRMHTYHCMLHAHLVGSQEDWELIRSQVLDWFLGNAHPGRTRGTCVRRGRNTHETRTDTRQIPSFGALSWISFPVRNTFAWFCCWQSSWALVFFSLPCLPLFLVLSRWSCMGLHSRGFVSLPLANGLRYL